MATKLNFCMIAHGITKSQPIDAKWLAAVRHHVLGRVQRYGHAYSVLDTAGRNEVPRSLPPWTDDAPLLIDLDWGRVADDPPLIVLRGDAVRVCSLMVRGFHSAFDILFRREVQV